MQYKIDKESFYDSTTYHISSMYTHTSLIGKNEEEEKEKSVVAITIMSRRHQLFIFSHCFTLCKNLIHQWMPIDCQK